MLTCWPRISSSLPISLGDPLSRLNKLSAAVWGFFHKSQPMQDSPGWTIFGAGIPSSWGGGWWQQGASDPKSVQENSAVEACVSQYARTIAMLPIIHYRDLSSGGKVVVKDSPVAKVLRRPNPYQTRADFVVNLVRQELFTGNGYAVAVRDPDFRVSQLHLLPPTGSRHHVDPEDGAVYYRVSGNELLPGGDSLVPSRDMLHIRMQTSSTDPLQGITPLQAGLMAASAGSSIQKHNAAFFNNMSRPSGTVNTDLELDAEQTAALRRRWEEQSQGLNAGKTPVLSHGLKWNPLSITATDAEMIEFYKLTVADIARIYGIPQALIGLMESSTLGNVETLLQMWVSTALGYMVDHIELALGVLFGLPATEHIEFDLDYILRGDFDSRMGALNKGILGGVYSVNEARAKEGLAPVEAGDEPRVQQQVVPLSWWADQRELDRQRLEIEQDKTVAEPNPPVDDEKFADAFDSIKLAMLR